MSDMGSFVIGIICVLIGLGLSYLGIKLLLSLPIFKRMANKEE
jgi:hypothetical protein